MNDILKLIAAAIIVGNAIANITDKPYCKEGYVRVTMMSARTVCIVGYYKND